LDFGPLTLYFGIWKLDLGLCNFRLWTFDI
jgi:hypothetical protein